MKGIIVLLLLTSICVAIVLVAGHVAADGTTAPRVMVNEQGTWYRADHVVTKDQMGQTLKATVGDLVDITLSANATTGYSWRCTVTPAANASMVRAVYATDAAPQGMVGVGGTQHFLLRADKPGETKVTVQYGRWWEGGDRNEPLSFTIAAVEPPKP